MRLHPITCLLLLQSILAAYASPVSDSHFYRLESATPLKGATPEWDYLAYDPATANLFIGRRDAGLSVFDTHTNTVVKTIERSEGAGAILLLPELDRGYTTNEDGSTTVFNLTTLATLDRIKFADDADAGFYDSATRQIAFMSGDSKKITFVDAVNGKINAQLAMPSKKLEASVADGSGVMFTAERDRDMIARIDMRTHTVLAAWPTEMCAQPTGLAIDQAHSRLFIGCRGDKPVLAVMDSHTGHVITTLPLGRGNDGVVFEPVTSRIFASNGVEANIVIYKQDDADHYKLDQAINTRPNARTLAVDIKGNRLFTVTAEGFVDPAKPINTGPSAFYANRFYDNSFVVLTYGLVH